MSRPRTACTDCALPFYSDVNESCPYCGAPGPTDARAAPGRERVTCSDCGLPHYGTDCPYCAAADGGMAPPTAEADPASTADPARERVTCPDCGLAHYADAEECPYCATARTNAAVTGSEDTGEAAEAEVEETAGDPAVESEPEPESATDSDRASEPETPPPAQRQHERRQSDDGSRTVVGRVIGAVRSLFGG